MVKYITQDSVILGNKYLYIFLQCYLVAIPNSNNVSKLSSSMSDSFLAKHSPWVCPCDMLRPELSKDSGLAPKPSFASFTHLSVSNPDHILCSSPDHSSMSVSSPVLLPLSPFLYPVQLTGPRFFLESHLVTNLFLAPGLCTSSFFSTGLALCLCC